MNGNIRSPTTSTYKVGVGSSFDNDPRTVPHRREAAGRRPGEVVERCKPCSGDGLVTISSDMSTVGVKWVHEIDRPNPKSAKVERTDSRGTYDVGGLTDVATGCGTENGGIFMFDARYNAGFPRWSDRVSRSYCKTVNEMNASR